MQTIPEDMSDYLTKLDKTINNLDLPEGTTVLWQWDVDRDLLKFLIERRCCYKRIYLHPYPIEDVAKAIQKEIHKGIVIKIGI